MIIGGNSVGCGGNIPRLAALNAGLPSSIPSLTIDQQCASSLAAITTAAAMIESGLSGLVIAGGFESTFGIFNPREGDEGITDAPSEPS